jgi:hypothetical protein
MRLLRRILLILFAVAMAFSLPSDALAKGKPRGSHTSGSETSVRGYTRKDGTYVAPHQRTTPDKSKSNNWSTKGNVNPHTGKPGTKEP